MANALKAKGLSLLELSKKTGISYNKLISFASLKSRIPNEKERAILSAFLEIPMELLFDDYENIFSAENKKIEFDISKDRFISIQEVPKVKLLAADFNVEEQLSKQAAVSHFLTVLEDKDFSQFSKTVIIKYFGLDGEKPLTLEEIAGILKITQERVRQIKERAIRKLKFKGLKASDIFCSEEAETPIPIEHIGKNLFYD